MRLTLGRKSSFLKHHLPKFAKENPSIEITVSPRPHKHPIIRGVYSNSYPPVPVFGGVVWQEKGEG